MKTFQKQSNGESVATTIHLSCELKDNKLRYLAKRCYKSVGNGSEFL